MEYPAPLVLVEYPLAYASQPDASVCNAVLYVSVLAVHLAQYVLLPVEPAGIVVCTSPVNPTFAYQPSNLYPARVGVGNVISLLSIVNPVGAPPGLVPLLRLYVIV